MRSGACRRAGAPRRRLPASDDRRRCQAVDRVIRRDHPRADSISVVVDPLVRRLREDEQLPHTLAVLAARPRGTLTLRTRIVGAAHPSARRSCERSRKSPDNASKLALARAASALGTRARVVVSTDARVLPRMPAWFRPAGNACSALGLPTLMGNLVPSIRKESVAQHLREAARRLDGRATAVVVVVGGWEGLGHRSKVGVAARASSDAASVEIAQMLMLGSASRSSIQLPRQ